MHAGKIIGPSTVSVPVVLSLTGLELPDGPGPVSLRDLMILVAVHGAMSRESTTLASAGALARQAVAVADEVLRARAVAQIAPATPVPPPPAVQGG